MSLCCSMQWLGCRFSSMAGCRYYTFLLLCCLLWPHHACLHAVCLGFICPMFPPKKKSEEEIVKDLMQAVSAFAQEHGRLLLRRDDLDAGQKLYSKLPKHKKLHLLQHDPFWWSAVLSLLLLSFRCLVKACRSDSTVQRRRRKVRKMRLQKCGSV